MNSILTKQIADDRLSHAYLFLGRDANLLKQEAENIASRLQVNQADLIIVDENGSIKIDQIRKIVSQISLKPHSSFYKIIIISKAENLTPEASNALLKILEEAPKHSIIILLADNEKNLLPTIVSRCQKIRINSSISEEVDPQWQELLNRLNKLTIKERFALANDLAKDEKLPQILNQWLIFFRQRMLKGESVNHIIEKINQAKKLLRTNINVRLLLENLLLEP